MKTIANRTKVGYFKLAKFCQISMTWKDGKAVFSSEDLAKLSAKKPGRYRISKVDDKGRHDMQPFSI